MNKHFEEYKKIKEMIDKQEEYQQEGKSELENKKVETLFYNIGSGSGDYDEEKVGSNKISFREKISYIFNPEFWKFFKFIILFLLSLLFIFILYLIISSYISERSMKKNIQEFKNEEGVLEEENKAIFPRNYDLGKYVLKPEYYQLQKEKQKNVTDEKNDDNQKVEVIEELR